MEKKIMYNDNMTSIFSTLCSIANKGSNVFDYVSLDNIPIFCDQIDKPTHPIDGIDEPLNEEEQPSLDSNNDFLTLHEGKAFNSLEETMGTSNQYANHKGLGI